MKQQMQDFSLNLKASARLALIVAVSALAACGQPAPEKLMAQAKASLAKGDRNAAVIQLKNVLQQAPNDGEARLLLGQTLFEAGDYASAEKELGRALALKQPHEKAVPMYVRTLLALGKYREVVTEAEKFRLFSPAAVASTQTAVGDAYSRLGNFSQAREAYRTALAAITDYPRARLGEAIVIAAEGRLDEAMEQADQVIARDATLSEAHGLKAELLLAKGDAEGAKMSLERAIAANDGYLPARFALIRLLIDEGNFQAAEKVIESSRRVARGDLQVAYLDAVLALRKGNLEKSRQLVQEVLKYLPENLPALLLAAQIDYQSKQFNAAETNLRKVIARAPNHVGARQLLAQTYLRMGQPAKAKDALQPLVELGLPDLPALLLVAGETFLANGDVQRATAFYQAAAKGQGAPQIAARTRLGQLALASGRSEEGFAELQAASALDATAYQADLARIAGHLRRNETDDALNAVKVLEGKQPENPLTFHMYGSVYVAKRDLESARKSFEKALALQPTYLPSAYSLAQIDILQRRPDDARTRYEAMIAKEPNNEQVYLALAELQTRTGAAQKDVIETLRRAVKANARAAAPRVVLINTLLRGGETKAALSAAQDAMAVMPSDPSVLDAVALAQETAGEVNQAIGTYNKLASLQPQAPQPLYRLTALYLRQKDTDKAIETLRRAQKIVPRERDVIPQLVQVYMSAGRHDDALKEARALQAREPRFAGGWSLEADVFFSQRKFPEAERLYRNALRLDPQANAVAVKLHRTLIAAGKKSEADLWGQKWLVINPKDTLMRLYLAELEQASKNLKAAAGHYRVVVELDPKNYIALNNLAWLGGELGDPKALDYAERALNLAPLNASVLDTYGTLLVKKGELDKGVRALSLARQFSPENKQIQLNFAKALIKAGKRDDARKELEGLLAAKENDKTKSEVAALLKGL